MTSKQDRFDFLADGGVTKADIGEVVKMAREVNDENKQLKKELNGLQQNKHTWYKNWAEGWNLAGVEWWAFGMGHVIIILCLGIGLTGIAAVVQSTFFATEKVHHEAVLTNTYYVRTRPFEKNKECTEIYRLVTWGSPVKVSPCFLSYDEALHHMTNTVAMAGGDTLNYSAEH